MSSRLKRLLIFGAAFLIVTSFLFPVSCTEQLNGNSPVQDEIGVTDSGNVVMVAVGDVMLARKVGEEIEKKGVPEAPFLETAGLLAEADITFCNLESPFYDEGPPSKEWMVFKAEPITVEGLKYAGFDVVSLANNHFGDQGVAGMFFTLSHLNDNEIDYVGAGECESQAREPTIIERNGVKFAFLGYNDVQSANRKGYAATPEKPGFAVLTRGDLVEDIEQAKKRADVVIVSIHWGKEYEHSPTERQRAFAHLAIDNGASLVLGHHPHVVQPLEKYKDGYIFYSLGNFVFDQMWSEETRNGLITRIFFEGSRIIKLETIQVKIYDSHQPRLVNWEQGLAFCGFGVLKYAG